MQQCPVEGVDFVGPLIMECRIFDCNCAIKFVELFYEATPLYHHQELQLRLQYSAAPKIDRRTL